MIFYTYKVPVGTDRQSEPIKIKVPALTGFRFWYKAGKYLTT